MRKKRSTGLWEVPGSDLLDTSTVADQITSSLHLLEKRVSSLEESPNSCRYGNAVYTTGAKWLPAECLSCSCHVSGLNRCGATGWGELCGSRGAGVQVLYVVMW